MANLQNFIQDHKHVWCQDASVSSIQSHVSPCTSMYALSENISTFIDAFMNLDKAWCVLTQNMTMELLLLVLFVEWLHYVIAIYYRWMKAKPRVARNICTECNQKPGLLTMHVLQQLKSTYRMDWVHEDANHSILNKCNTTLQDRICMAIATLNQLFCSTNTNYPSSTTQSHAKLHKTVSQVNPVESEKGALQLIFIAAILGMIPLEHTLDAWFCTDTRVAQIMKPIVGCSSIAIWNILY